VRQEVITARGYRRTRYLALHIARRAPDFGGWAREVVERPDARGGIVAGVEPPDASEVESCGGARLHAYPRPAGLRGMVFCGCLMVMRPETARNLHEARDARNSAQAGFTMVNSMNAGGAGAVFTSAELAIKSVVVEKHGAILAKYHNHRLVDLAKSMGLWSELPPDLRTFVSDISTFHPDVRYAGEPPHETLVNSTTPAQWQNWLAESERLVDFVEQRVIADPVAFARLKP
jgi:hypothetical protein